MKILIICFFIIAFIAPVSADSYVVISQNDERVLEEKDKDQQQSVASISKVMTAILSIEYLNMNKQVKVGNEILTVEGSSIYLEENEKIKVETLLYGLMLRSGNDAAVVLAKQVSGSNKKFVDLMNKKALEIGMKNTIFNNPSGLDENGGNISTAYDMALLYDYAFKNKTFKKIVGTKYYRHENNGVWKNKNKLLFINNNVDGGKTGYTKIAGRTLISSSNTLDTGVIIVTLGASDDFKFHDETHNTYLPQLESKLILRKGILKYHQDDYLVNSDIYITLKRDIDEEIKYSYVQKDNTLKLKISIGSDSKTYVFDRC